MALRTTLILVSALWIAMTVNSFVASASTSTIIDKVVVVGGTHGNEYTGVWCIKALDRLLAQGKRRYSFDLSTIVGNPVAHSQNKRFVDADLNRQFSHQALVESPTTNTVEGRRAQELDQLLGPKFGGKEPPKVDLLIDLHTTTANMGTTIIVGAGNPLTTQAAAYILQKCQGSHILMHTHADQHERPHLSSIAPHSLSIEVGPVPQGVLRHDKVQETQRALDAGLEFLERFRKEPEALMDELRKGFPSGRVPCIRSAPAKRPGEMSSKLVWPSDAENPNFPQWIVHESLQDRDFQLLQQGDPLFVDLDGNAIPYDGSQGSPIRVMFINEGGYYYASSGTGVSVAVLDEFDLETGELLETTIDATTTTNEL